MDSPVIIRGVFANRVFVPADPLPETEGPAELIVYSKSTVEPRHSILDAFGTAEHLRTAEDLDAQLAEERAAWGDS